nr:DUF1648 domain-containing protein [uncultured Caproiciproducens sp.]
MSRPKIELPYSRLEKLIQILSFFSLLVLIGLTVFSMIHLPGRIPTHFGASGRADGWGGKGSLLMLPVMAVILYVAMTILERFPWAYNYAVEITEENAAYQYKLGRQMLEWIKCIIIVIFLYLQWQTEQVARGLSAGLGAWFLPVSMLALFGGLGFGIYKMIKHK